MPGEVLFIFMLASVQVGGSYGGGGSSSSPKVQVLNGSPYVTLKHGLYFGKTIKNGDWRKEDYYAFLGIRYAETPQRFEKSVPMSDLDTVPVPLLAQSLGAPCPQISPDGFKIIGKEDCLFGNIYVPMMDPEDDDGFPVIVFIHPGSFKSGSGGTFDVDYFMSENVICATFNFRIGALGFLSTEDGAIPGSLGLRDQITFLKWINENIEEFGGNKRRITIAGVEAGATSVKHLLLTQNSKGLFQSAIIHGSSMFSTFFAHSTISTSSIIRQQFSDELECPIRPSHLFAECMKIKRLRDLMLAQKSISEKYLNLSSPFLPGYEKCTRPGSPSCLDPFFPKSPALLLAERQYKRVPLLIGMDSVEMLRSNYIREGSIPILHAKSELERDTLTTWLLGILKQIPGFRHEEFITNSYTEIQQLYFNESKGNNGLMVYNSLKHFLHDIFAVYEVWKFARTYARDKPVYPYVISFQGNRSTNSIFHADNRGSTFPTSIYETFLPDGIEFLTPSLPNYHEFETGSDEERFSRDLVHLWTTFATHRKPVDVWQNKETWMPLSVAQLNGEKVLTWYALKGRRVDVIPEPFTKRMKFWDRLFKEETSAN